MGTAVGQRLRLVRHRGRWRVESRVRPGRSARKEPKGKPPPKKEATKSWRVLVTWQEGRNQKRGEARLWPKHLHWVHRTAKNGVRCRTAAVQKDHEKVCRTNRDTPPRLPPRGFKTEKEEGSESSPETKFEQARLCRRRRG